LGAARRADVRFQTGILTIAADNSSLNQILRDVGRATGMKITGGVSEERVYGAYGPGDTSSVLTALLNGTGSNMLLVLDRRDGPRELVLTPRNGGPTPPNPNAIRDAGQDADDLPPQRMQRIRQLQQPLGGFQPGSQPAQQPFQPPLPPEVPQPPAAQQPVGPASDTTTQQSPNAVKTPQEIYEQLIKMQQQQHKPPPL
jgi:hypothetical protein